MPPGLCLLLCRLGYACFYTAWAMPAHVLRAAIAPLLRFTAHGLWQALLRTGYRFPPYPHYLIHHLKRGIAKPGEQAALAQSSLSHSGET
jgi:hypothetical protein